MYKKNYLLNLPIALYDFDNLDIFTINLDGEINVLDVIGLVNMILGSEEMNSSGDLSGDGVVNILDVIQLVNIILND